MAVFTGTPELDVSRETSTPPWAEPPAVAGVMPDPEFPGLVNVKYANGTDTQYLFHPNGGIPQAGYKYMAISGDHRVWLFVPLGMNAVPVVLRVDPL